MSKLIIALFVLFCSQTVMAQSLAEKKLYSQEEQAIESQVAHINKQCQTEIKVRFDWTNFTKEGLVERGAASFCNEALSAIGRVCEGGDDETQSVQSNINEVVCSRTTPRHIELKDHVLNFGMDYDAANDADAVYEYLMDNLP